MEWKRQCCSASLDGQRVLVSPACGDTLEKAIVVPDGF
jgi:hypothetical protein